MTRTHHRQIINGRLTLYTVKAKAEHELMLSAQGYLAFRQEFISGRPEAWEHMVRCHELMIETQARVDEVVSMLGKMNQEEWVQTPEGQEYLSNLGKEEAKEQN